MPPKRDFPLYFILGIGCLQITYLLLLYDYWWGHPVTAARTIVTVPACLTLIYLIPAIFYLCVSERTKGRDRVFIVWGCATTFLVSLFCLANLTE